LHPHTHLHTRVFLQVLLDYQYVKGPQVDNGYTVCADRNICFCLSWYPRPSAKQQTRTAVSRDIQDVDCFYGVLNNRLGCQGQVSAHEITINVSCTSMKWQCWAYHRAWTTIAAEALRNRVAETQVEYETYHTRHAYDAASAHERPVQYMQAVAASTRLKSQLGLWSGLDSWPHPGLWPNPELWPQVKRSTVHCDAPCDMRCMVITSLMLAAQKTGLHKIWKKMLPADTDRLWASAISTHQMFDWLQHRDAHLNVVRQAARWHVARLCLTQHSILPCWMGHAQVMQAWLLHIAHLAEGWCKSWC